MTGSSLEPSRPATVSMEMRWPLAAVKAKQSAAKGSVAPSMASGTEISWG